MRPLALSLLLLSTGCLFYTSHLEIAPTSAGQAELSSDEVTRANEIVAKILSERDFRIDPNAKRIEQLSRVEKEWGAVVLAAYDAPSEAWPHDGVGVSVLLEKATGRLRVRIIDTDWPFRDDYTESLERSLVDALAAAFPDRDVRLD